MIGILPEELIIDNFAGGGGASLGIERALGRPIDVAINHDRQALAMHRRNHPDTLHLIEDVWRVDIPKLLARFDNRPVGLAWFSPDCKHFSKAKGAVPVSKKIRGLAWVVLKWAAIAKPRVICLENVEEFQTWGPVVDGKPCKRRKGMTFKRWLTQLRNLGYRIEYRELVACKYGARTIRKRLMVVGRRDGLPIEWPEETHGPEGNLFLQPYRTAAECIDWSIPCKSIFDRPRPLADKTMRRIARGVMRYVVNSPQPFIVNLTHTGGDRVESLHEPMRTITAAKRGEKALVTPFLAGVGGRMGQSAERSIDDPYHTITAKADTALVVPHITRFNQNGCGSDLKEPLDTVMAGAHRFGIVSAFLAHTAHGDEGKAGSKRWGKGERSATEPLPTVATSGDVAVCAAFLAKHYGGNETPGSALSDPLATVTTKDHHALAAVHLARQMGKSVGHGADEPLGTVTAGGGGKSALVASSVVKMRGSNIGHPLDEPLHTISAGGTHHAELRAFLVKYYGTATAASLSDPMHSVTTKDRIAACEALLLSGSLTPEQLRRSIQAAALLREYGLWDDRPVITLDIKGEVFIVVDIGMRMLTPRELFRAQGFGDDYHIETGVDADGKTIPLTKTAQVRMVGNSVSPPMAEAVVRAQFGLGVVTQEAA